MNIVISNNAGTIRDIIDPATSILDLCEKYGLNVAAGGIMVNGSTLNPAQMAASPADLGLSGTIFLSQFRKLDNAAA